jgi:hypothetical protein
MKQYNRMIFAVILVWLIAVGITALFLNGNINNKQDKAYLVEINRLQDRLTGQKYYSEVDLTGCRYVVRVDYYPTPSKESVLMEYHNKPGATEGLTEDKMEELAEGMAFFSSS